MADMTMFAKARSFSFDKIDVGEYGAVYMPVNYGNLTWAEGWAVADSSIGLEQFPNSGFFSGITSGDHVAFSGSVDENNNVIPLEISAKSFDIAGLNITAPWDKKMLVEIIASQNGEIVYDQTFNVNDRAPLHIDLNLKRIDDIIFTSTEIKVGPRNDPASGAFMVFDDIEISNVKPLNSAAFVTDHHTAMPVATAHVMDAHFVEPPLGWGHVTALV